MRHYRKYEEQRERLGAAAGLTGIIYNNERFDVAAVGNVGDRAINNNQHDVVGRKRWKCIWEEHNCPSCPRWAQTNGQRLCMRHYRKYEEQRERLGAAAGLTGIIYNRAINNNQHDVAAVNVVDTTDNYPPSASGVVDIGDNENRLSSASSNGDGSDIGQILRASSNEVVINELRDVAVGQLQRTSHRPPGRVGNTSINNEDLNMNMAVASVDHDNDVPLPSQDGECHVAVSEVHGDHLRDDDVDNATRRVVGFLQGREDPQITTRTGNGEVEVGFNELRTEDHLGVAMVPTIRYLQQQLELRDTKISALEQRMSALHDSVEALQDRWRQSMSRQQNGASIESLTI